MKTKFTFLIILSVFLLNTNSFSQDFGCNAKIDASNEYIDIGNNTDYYGTSLTVEARINADSWKTNIHEGTVLSCGTWNGGECGWDLRAANNGKLSFNFSNGSGWHETMTTTNPMLINQWYHVAATFDNGVVNVYIDGVLIETQTFAFNIAPSTTNLYIGTCPAETSRNFDGYIDEVRIWNIALDESTILAWYN